MAINPFWQNSFGANVADAGVDPSGLMAPPPTTGNGLFGMWQGLNADPTKRDALQAFAGQLLAGSGYGPRQSGSEVFGRALLASQAARAASLEQIQKKKLQDAQIAAANAKQSPFGNVDPEKFTPESIARFQRSGNYGDLVGDPAALAGKTPSDVATYEYWKNLTPQQRQDFLKLKRNIGSDYEIVIINGVPTLVYKPGANGVSGPLGTFPGAPPAPGAVPPSGGSAPPANAPPANPPPSGPSTNPPFMKPLTTLDDQARGAATVAQATSTGAAIGTAAGEATGAQIKRGVNADTVTGLLDVAEPLIDASTGSATGAAVDKLAGWFGKAPEGAQAAAQLKVVQAGLMTNMPRMEGPQSDRDVQLYRDASGQIGDPTVPRAIKKVALKTIRQIQERYKDASKQIPQIYPNGSPEAAKADIEAEMRKRGLLK